MAGAERRSFGERAVELSQKIDKYTIIAGAGIFILVSASVGAAIILGSVATIIPAKAIERRLKKRKAKKY